MVRLTEFRSFLQQKSARNLAKLINKTSLGTIQERQLMIRVLYVQVNHFQGNAFTWL